MSAWSRHLYLRIWLTVLAALSLFALASGWLVQRHMAQERQRFETVAQGRAEAWADLLERSLPASGTPREQQAAALAEWSQRLRMPLALDDAAGQRIGVSDVVTGCFCAFLCACSWAALYLYRDKNID